MDLGHPCYSYLTIVNLYVAGWQKEDGSKPFGETFCCDLHLPVLCSGRLEKDLLKEGEVWWKIISNKIIFKLVIFLIIN